MPGSRCSRRSVSATAVPDSNGCEGGRMTDAVTVTKRFVGGRPQRASRKPGCAMQRRRPNVIARCWRWVPLVVGTLFASGSVYAATDLTASTPTSSSTNAMTALHWPLASAHRALRGGFGESRTNRFHAGLDLSTGGHVGEEVLAPAA